MPMAPRNTKTKCSRKEVNRGAWTAEEDQKLAQVIEIHGPKRWKSVAAKAVPKRSEEGTSKRNDDDDDSKTCFIADSLFDFYYEEPLNLEWTSQFFEMDETNWFNFAYF
ncbi:hypothetical protein COLO4_21136 [Corchorus olitorius]|uniref:Uncharacterized protein n=1 Tax=Corchorus olitorius TaxID=93759 RepID=A0A1R3IV60_9ROSI|nr:hypothetical protein COLO4_21136 [Corchorus olitorius]